jgi:hypothetical protein
MYRTSVNPGFGRLLWLLALLSLLAPAPSAHATTTWVVRNYGDGAADATRCLGVNCRLRDAIAAAASGDTITFNSAGHTIQLTQGELNLNKDVTIFFVGDVGDIALDAQSASRAMNIASGTTATLDKLAIVNGKPAVGFNGGAIRVASTATLNLNNVSIGNSQVQGSGDVGGAIYNIGTLNLTNFAFIYGNQTGPAGQGGALYNAGTASLNGNLNGDGSRSIRFFASVAVGDGGAIYNDGSLSATNIQINTSQARNGGAIYNNGTLLLDKSLVVSNHATGTGINGIGGGFFNTVTGTLTIVDSAVDSNTATNEGGGLASLGFLNLGRSLVYNNSVNSGGRWGGGIANEGTLTALNSTISSNSAPGDGGGIMNVVRAVTDLNNVTITKNTADSDADGNGNGGGVYGGCPSGQLCLPGPITITLKNSIISGNFDTPNNAGPGIVDPDCKGPLESLGYNLVYNTVGCTINGNTTGNILGQPVNLAALTDNGGWTLTHALTPSSPALDAGSPATPGSGGGACLLLDQRGVRRNLDRCDMGAYERVFLQLLPLVLR